MLIVLQKGAPGTSSTLRCWRNATAAQDIANGYFIDAIAQFEQFTLDFPVAHPCIFARQPHHQGFQLGSDTRTTTGRCMLKCPFMSHQFAVPFQDCLWLDEQQTRPQVILDRPMFPVDAIDERYQHDLLGSCTAHLSLHAALQDTQLLAQQRNFQIFLLGSKPYRAQDI